MRNRRISERSYTYAKVHLTDYDEIGYIRDISPAGVRLELIEASSLETGIRTPAVLMPHQDFELEPFNADIEVRWIGENGPTTSVGILIQRFETAEGEASFFELLRRFRSIHKNSVENNY